MELTKQCQTLNATNYLMNLKKKHLKNLVYKKRDLLSIQFHTLSYTLDIYTVLFQVTSILTSLYMGFTIVIKYGICIVTKIEWMSTSMHEGTWGAELDLKLMASLKTTHMWIHLNFIFLLFLRENVFSSYNKQEKEWFAVFSSQILNLNHFFLNTGKS